jgi:hypothetical protein
MKDIYIKVNTLNERKDLLGTLVNCGCKVRVETEYRPDCFPDNIQWVVISINDYNIRPPSE